VFQYFPDNYMWSSGLNLAMMAGGDLGQIDRWLSPLRQGDPDVDAWTKAWDSAGAQQEEHAIDDLRRGFARSAGERLLRASTYYLTGERQTPLSPAKTNSYQHALRAFGEAVKYLPGKPERVEVASPDGLLPGWLIPAAGTTVPAPVVIFYNGFDVTKEILFGIIRDQFATRGIACLVIDTPGTGEPLRLRGVPSRPDYEVPTSAIVDLLETRPELDANRIGLLGISLGGYYAPLSTSSSGKVTKSLTLGSRSKMTSAPGAAAAR
jgi:Esterase FrsA-like